MRYKSKKKILKLEDITKPFSCVLSCGNTSIPRYGPVLMLQINGERRVFPVGERIDLDPISYVHIMDIRFNGRDFVQKGSYDEFIIE